MEISGYTYHTVVLSEYRGQEITSDLVETLRKEENLWLHSCRKCVIVIFN